MLPVRCSTSEGFCPVFGQNVELLPCDNDAKDVRGAEYAQDEDNASDEGGSDEN